MLQNLLVPLLNFHCVLLCSMGSSLQDCLTYQLIKVLGRQSPYFIFIFTPLASTMLYVQQILENIVEEKNHLTKIPGKNSFYLLIL